jgi:hypothetical protein
MRHAPRPMLFAIFGRFIVGESTKGICACSIEDRIKFGLWVMGIKHLRIQMMVLIDFPPPDEILHAKV